ncbi:MAG: hypothetical protein K6F55_03585 [Eubacterium sp.]|nr:hypothetical protein [Eubacterium sp.]
MKKQLFKYVVTFSLVAATILGSGYTSRAAVSSPRVSSSKTISKKSSDNGWKKVKVNGKKYKRYYKKGKYATGRTNIKGDYYFFTPDGLLLTGDFKYNNTKYYTDSDGVILGIKYKNDFYYATGKKMTDDDELEFETILRAKDIVDDITSPGQSKSSKLVTCMKWVQSHPYKTYGHFSMGSTWTARYANQVYQDGGSDCHGDAAAFAYMAVVIGYDDVYVSIDSTGYTGSAGGHSWAEIGNYAFDPLFAEAKSWSQYYDVPYGSYPLSHITHTKIPYMSPKHASKHAKKLPNDGFTLVKGNYYFFNKEKKTKNKWMKINGSKYHFGNDGKAAKFCSKKIKNKYYIFGEDAKLLKGKKVRVVELSDGKYRVNKNGTAMKGWASNKKSYFDETGKMVTGKVLINGKYYIFDANGILDEAATKKINTTEAKTENTTTQPATQN